MVAALFLASQIPPLRARVVRWAEAGLTERIGREVRVERVDFRPLQGHLALHHVQVASGPRLQDGVLLAVDSLRLGWSWTALFRRTLVFDHVLIARPRLTLPSGESSTPPLAAWLSSLLDTSSSKPNRWSIDVPRAEIEDGNATWENDGTPGSLEGVHGFVERRNQNGVASLVGTLRASRLLLPLGGVVREVTQLTLQVGGTLDVLSIAAVEAVAAETRVSGKGRILDLAGAPQLDLDLALSSPLAALFRTAGVPGTMDALLTAEGNLRGPWNRAVFQGRGSLQVPTPSRTLDSIPFAIRWADRGLELETPPGGPPESLWWKLTVEPATGAYRARLNVREADLGVLTGLPALAAGLVGFTMPAAVGGRLTADVDLMGRGKDLATLRGHGTLRVEDLRVEAGLPAGRLEADLVATRARLALRTFSLDVPGATVRGHGSVTFADARVDLPIQAEIRSMAALGRGFGLFALDGHATLGGRLTGTWEAPRFQGSLTWREPRIALYAVDQIAGDIEWLPRTLRSPRLIVRVGQTVATLRGSVAAPGSTPLRSLDFRRDLTFDLQGQVNPGRTADLAQFLPADLDLRTAFRASGRIAGTPQTPTGEIEVAGTNIEAWGEKWERGDAVVRLAPGAFEIAGLSLRRGTERVTGEFRFEKGGGVRGRLSGAGMDLGQLRVLVGSQVSGRGLIRLDLQRSEREWRVEGQATTDALGFRGIPFGPAGATFTIAAGAFDLNLTLQDGSHRLKLNRAPPPERRWRVDLALSDADLAPLLRLAEVDVSVLSQAKGTGRIRMDAPAGDLAAGEGDATFSLLRLRVGDDTWHNRGPAELAWRGRTVDVRRLGLHSGARDLDIRGTLEEGDRTDLHVRGQLPLLTVKARLPFGHFAGGMATADLHIRGALSAPAIDGTLQVMDGKIMLTGVPTPFEELRGAVELDGARARIRDLRGQVAGGDLRASADVSWQGDAWSFQAAFQADETRAERLLAGLYTGTGEVTGALSLRGTLASRGRGAEGFWSNLDGQLKLVMRDGQLGRKTLMVRALSLMNLEGLLHPRAEAVSGSGIPYQRLTSDITIEQGVARTENVLLESPAFLLSAHGDVDLVKETLEMDMAVKPLHIADRVVTSIPMVGWLLGGKDGALIAAFYRVTGPLSDPEVRSLPAKSLQRNVLGTFQRLLQIPEAATAP